jgi:tRNA (guanine-N7-)-methyltransferase
LCPDPWPKNRHRGNRLLCSDFTTQLHRVLKSDGIFHFSSDDEYYCDAVNKVVAASGLFEAYQEGIADLEGVKSDFEKRWLSEGKMVHHRAWKKLPLPEVTIGH